MSTKIKSKNKSTHVHVCSWENVLISENILTMDFFENFLKAAKAGQNFILVFYLKATF